MKSKLVFFHFENFVVLVVQHELVEALSVDQVDDALADHLGQEELPDEVHVSENFLLLKVVIFGFFGRGHFFVRGRGGFHGNHHVDVALERVLDFLQKYQFEHILVVFLEARLVVQEKAQLGVNIGVFLLRPSFLYNCVDHFFQGVSTLKKDSSWAIFKICNLITSKLSAVSKFI